MPVFRRNKRRRVIGQGDTFTFDEDRGGRIEREIPPENPDPPPEKWRGEPWGWVKDDPPPEALRFQRGDFPPGYRDGA
jgi:hypothetical protein